MTNREIFMFWRVIIKDLIEVIIKREADLLKESKNPKSLLYYFTAQAISSFPNFPEKFKTESYLPNEFKVNDDVRAIILSILK